MDFDELTQYLEDIKPHIPSEFTLFHGVSNALSMIQAPARAAASRQEEADKKARQIQTHNMQLGRYALAQANHLISQQREARLQAASIITNAKNQAYTNFLNAWQMPPNVAMAYQAAFQGLNAANLAGTPQQAAAAVQQAQQTTANIAGGTGGPAAPTGTTAATGIPQVVAQAAQNVAATMSAAMSPGSTAANILGSPARPPGPASAVVTPPYAGVLAGGSSAASGVISGGSELRDILSVLRDILDAIRQLKSQGGDDEQEDESESVENRRPPFKKFVTQIDPSRQSGPMPPPSASVSGIQRPQQDVSHVSSLMSRLIELNR